MFVTVKGAGVGSVFPGVQAAIGRDIYAYVPEPSVSARFVTQMLRFTTAAVVSRAQGDIPGLSKDHILNHRIPLPPSAEQDRIADALDELLSDLDSGVAALGAVKAKLAHYRASVLKAAVNGMLTSEWREQHPHTEAASELLERILASRRGGRVPDRVFPAGAALPGGWCWTSLGDISEIQGGIQKSPSRKPTRDHYPYLRVANVHRGSLDLRDLHRFELTSEELDRLRLMPDDLLIVEGNGSRNEIGRCAIWHGEIEDCVHQNHIIRVRPWAGVASPYVSVYLNSPVGQSAIQDVASSTSGLYTLSVSKIVKLPLPLPPVDEQGVIVEAVDDHLSILEHVESGIEDKLRSAIALRQAILRHAFTGRLVAQDPNDEPASELLRRIAMEREKRARATDAAKHKHVNGNAPRVGVRQPRKKRTKES